MNRTILAALVALLASPAAASRPLPTEALALAARGFENVAFAVPTDAFAHLAGLFAKGTAVTRADVEGWRSGRLYDHYAPSSSRSAILIGEVVSNVQDGGPAFGSSFKLVSMTAPGMAVDAFDKLDADAVQWVRTSFAKEATRTDEPVFGATGAVFLVSGALTVETRRAGDFLVSRHTDNDGKVVAYSYYFLVVTPAK